ncbi:MAG TPA: hypothetical protein VG276_26400 [Actinomycetes bacterium]|jgi:hypothetical protein|nr:hypothetical protein [Actinomycetes bacterium]
MPDGVVRLGRALTATQGPLVRRSARGILHAVWPYGPGSAPMALVIGSTGGGKTTLLRYMTTQLLREPGPKTLSLADGKGAGSFRMFADMPGVDVVANTPDQTTAMVHGYQDLVEWRYTGLSAARDTLAAGGPARYVRPGAAWAFIDEFMTWILSVPDTRPAKRRSAMISALVRIGAIGREVNCRLVIATQRPDAKSVDTGLPGVLKAQLKARIAATGAMGMDSVEARMAFDDDAYAHRVPDRVGGGLVKVGRHEVPFAVPWMADPTSPETSDEDREAAWQLLPRRRAARA